MNILEEPILKLIDRLETRGASGVQALSWGSQHVFVCLYDGKVEAVNSDREDDRLGHYLLKAGLISQEELDRVLRTVNRSRKRLGEVLVEQGLLDSASVTEILMEQAVNLFSRALTKGYQIGSFTSSPHWKMTRRLSLGYRSLALEMARRRPVELQLAPGQTIHLVPPEELTSLPWDPEEVSVLTHLRIPRDLSELIEATNLSDKQVRQTVQVLLDLGLVKIMESAISSETALAKWERLPLEKLVPEVRNYLISEKVEAVTKDYTQISEQFRALKVRLANQVDPPVRILSVTSPRPRDGKSLISTNLAMNFALEPGRRVLLIDADLREASVHEKLGITLGPGLYQYLLEGLEPQCYIRRVGPLFVMTAGELAGNAVELLSLGRMKDLIRFAGEQFDTVIVDAPPVLPVADARVIANLTEASILVVYQGRTPFRMVERSLEILDKGKLLGVVLNGVKTTGLNGYHSYGYYYTYPYGGDRKDGVIEVKARPRYTRRTGSSGSVLFK